MQLLDNLACRKRRDTCFQMLMQLRRNTLSIKVLVANVAVGGPEGHRQAFMGS